MRPRRLAIAVVALAMVGALLYVGAPYARAASLIVRAAQLGGRAEDVARQYASRVTKGPRHMVPTRDGDIAAQFYVPDADVDRTVLLIPGIHSMGIDEPRLTALANDLA